MSMKDELDAVLALPTDTETRLHDARVAMFRFLRAHGASLRAALENDRRYRFLRDDNLDYDEEYPYIVICSEDSDRLHGKFADEHIDECIAEMETARASENKTP